MPWLARDLRLALRVLRKEAAFTALAVLTLGLGIGAATTIFSVIDAVLFNPYPYAHIERNVALEVRDLSRAGAGGRAFFKLPELLDYKEQVQSFEDVIAAGFTDVLYTTAQGTEQFRGALMSGNNFEFLGIPAARGRTLLPEDARPGATPVCVMRHTTWATRFGSDPGVLGRTLVLNGVPTTVVGITPPRFQKMAADFYLPVSLDRADPEQRDRFFRLQARLKPGVSLAEAEAEVNLVARRVARLYPSEYPERFTVKVMTYPRGGRGPSPPDRVQQRGQHAARPGDHAGEGACGPGLAGGHASAPRRPASSGKPAPRPPGRGVRVPLLLLRHQGPRARHPRRAHPREAVIRLNLPVLLFSLGVAVLPRGSYASGSAKRQFFDQVLSRVQALPGVASASVTSSVPPFGGIRTEVEVPGRTHAQRWEALYELCSEGYFETLGLRPLRGRMLSAQDVADGRKVAVVNETLARRYYGDDDPVGRTIELKMRATLGAESVPDPVFAIVGVVADARNQGLQDPIMPQAFIPHSVTGAFVRGILVRTAGPPLALLESVRREVWAVDRNVAITTTGSLSGLIAQFALGEPRLTLVVLGVFAVLGLVLVALGVFSVVAYAVSRQTHEIGIRMALGAARADVLRSVVGGGLRLVGSGVGLGLLASLAATRVLSHQLFGVAPQDPITMGLVAALMSAVGFLASYLPARRATRVDPLVALRHE